MELTHFPANACLAGTEQFVMKVPVVSIIMLTSSVIETSVTFVFVDSLSSLSLLKLCNFESRSRNCARCSEAPSVHQSVTFLLCKRFPVRVQPHATFRDLREEVSTLWPN